MYHFPDTHDIHMYLFSCVLCSTSSISFQIIDFTSAQKKGNIHGKAQSATLTWRKNGNGHRWVPTLFQSHQHHRQMLRRKSKRKRNTQNLIPIRSPLIRLTNRNSMHLTMIWKPPHFSIGSPLHLLTNRNLFYLAICLQICRRHQKFRFRVFRSIPAIASTWKVRRTA